MISHWLIWLVVWNIAGLWLSHHIGNVIIPTDELHHFWGENCRIVHKQNSETANLGCPSFIHIYTRCWLICNICPFKVPIEKVDVLMFPWCSHDFPIKTRRFLRGGGRRYSPGVTLTRNMRVTRGQSCWARLEWRNFHGEKSEWVWRWRVQIRLYDIMICIYICVILYYVVTYRIWSIIIWYTYHII
jgi:hypothetical protein